MGKAPRSTGYDRTDMPMLIATIPDPDAILHPNREVALGKHIEPPTSYRFHPETIGRPDVYAAPDPSELVEITPGHVVRCQPV